MNLALIHYMHVRDGQNWHGICINRYKPITGVGRDTRHSTHTLYNPTRQEAPGALYPSPPARHFKTKLSTG